MVCKSNSRHNDKPEAVAVPSFVFTSKKREVSIVTDGLGTMIATVSSATPALSMRDTAVSTYPTMIAAK